MIAWDDQYEVVVSDVSSATYRAVGEGRFGVAWSPDGLSIAVGNGDELNILPVDDSSPRTLVTGLNGEVHGVVWDADGATIAFQESLLLGPTNVYRVGTDGSDLQRLSEGPAQDVAFLPG